MLTYSLEFLQVEHPGHASFVQTTTIFTPIVDLTHLFVLFNHLHYFVAIRIV